MVRFEDYRLKEWITLSSPGACLLGNSLDHLIRQVICFFFHHVLVRG